jgi:hypothetical protein
MRHLTLTEIETLSTALADITRVVETKLQHIRSLPTADIILHTNHILQKVRNTVSKILKPHCYKTDASDKLLQKILQEPYSQLSHQLYTESLERKQKQIKQKLLHHSKASLRNVQKSLQHALHPTYTLIHLQGWPKMFFLKKHFNCNEC